jgi:hypothetical protein
VFAGGAPTVEAVEVGLPEGGVAVHAGQLGGGWVFMGGFVGDCGAGLFVLIEFKIVFGSSSYHSFLVL